MAKSSKLYYGDKIKTSDGSIGTIKFIGELSGKEGIFYGIELIKGEGKNNGSIKNIQYFKTRQNKKIGRFIRESKLKLLKNNKIVEYTIGDRVLCTKSNPSTHGIIRYVGIPAFPNINTIQYGIQLESENGTCDGSIKGIGYFACQFKSKYGIYCRTKEVKKAKDKIGNKKITNKELPLSPKSSKNAINKTKKKNEKKDTSKKPETKNNLSGKKSNSIKKNDNNNNIKENIDDIKTNLIDKPSKHSKQLSTASNASSTNVGTGAEMNYDEKEKDMRNKWGKNSFLEVYSSSMSMWCPAHIQQVMLKNEQQPIDIFLVFYTNQNGEEFTKYLDRWSPYLRGSTVQMSPLANTPIQTPK